MSVGKYTLIAFDTDHIKAYVFGTDRLKEIRGASSIIDHLNRNTMTDLAKQFHAIQIFANGGAGLFIVKAEKAEAFGQLVQQAYKKQTKGEASITFVTQGLADDVTGRQIEAPGDELKDWLNLHHVKNQGEIQPYLTCDLSRELELIRYRLREEKACPPSGFRALPSHPFMRPCNSCGTNYAEEYHAETPGEESPFYCASCREKQLEDDDIKKEQIPAAIKQKPIKQIGQEHLWDHIITCLKKINYRFPDNLKTADLPDDFNEFGLLSGSKRYLGLIYADGNNMGAKIEELKTLWQIAKFAQSIDDSIFQAMSVAIERHLPIVDVKREHRSASLLPFDILLIGGDDIVMVTHATKAMEVALTIAQEFRRLSGYTLSVGVVLAPVKYPFGLSREIAEDALKFAKSESAKARNQGESDDTRINFLSVTGGSSTRFKHLFDTTYHRKDDYKKKFDEDIHGEFFATLRPYRANDLVRLLETIRASKKGGLNLGRTKLHQLREAVLEKNLTTAVSKGMALLGNWRDRQRAYVVKHIYDFGGRFPMPPSNPHDPVLGFPRITFPWFTHKDDKNKHGQNIYRTPLLDFIELYDFVAGGEQSDEE